jgi:hypothetical protein
MMAGYRYWDLMVEMTVEGRVWVAESDWNLWQQLSPERRKYLQDVGSDGFKTDCGTKDKS